MDDDAILADYLLRVGKAARRLPRGRREWVVSQIGDRLAQALDDGAGGAGGAGGVSGVATVLAQFGAPAALVQAVDGHVPGDEARWADYLAVLLLVIGGIAFLPAWSGGAVLLWASPRWQLRERLIGSLIWPGGLAGFWYLLTAPSVTHPFQRGWFAYPSLTRQLYNPLLSYPRELLTLLALLGLGAVQALAGIWLLRRARRPEPPQPMPPSAAQPAVHAPTPQQ